MFNCCVCRFTNYQLPGRAVDWSDSKIPGQTELRVQMSSSEKLKDPCSRFQPWHRAICTCKVGNLVLNDLFLHICAEDFRMSVFIMGCCVCSVLCRTYAAITDF